MDKSKGRFNCECERNFDSFQSNQEQFSQKAIELRRAFETMADNFRKLPKVHHKRTTMESSILGTDWMEYYCKSGELLFYYNKVTAEHRWSDISN
ncbi:hypothetical protein QZH41_015657, partial [Actinostola sp. cb2023]